MVGLAIGGGQTDFITEQQSLTIRNTTAKNTYSTLNSGIPSVGDTKTTTTPTPIIITEEDRAIAMHRLAHYEPENLSLALDVFNCAYVPSLSPSTSTGTSHPTPNIPASGWSAVDILVGTPGRILDHLDRTPGFTLQHLQFLVVDEADKLLMGQSRYHNWMERILSAATTTTTTTTANNDDDAKKSWDSNLGYTWNGMSILLEPRTFRSKWNRDDVVCPVQLRKFLVSATMTRDPQKLAALQLVHPIHYDMHRLPTNFLQNDKEENENSTQPLPIPKYAMPHGLEEFTVECTAEQKPLALLALLLEKLEECKKDGPRKKGSVIVIFTASLDSTHRLARLLQLVWMTLSDDNDDVEISSDFIAEFSSALRQHERSAIMARCNTDNNDDDKEDDSKKKKSLGVLVCTDGMSRGMDIGATVDLVINYDVPKHAKTYLHRCGRAARAGRTGTATTLLKGAGQAGAFVRMRNAIQNPESMQSKVIPTSFVRENVVAAYRHSVKALKEVLEAEANGDLGYTESLNSSFLPPQT
jgi:ATP-dependent RNA helicase DDX51/DBP6